MLKQKLIFSRNAEDEEEGASIWVKTNDLSTLSVDKDALKKAEEASRKKQERKDKAGPKVVANKYGSREATASQVRQASTALLLLLFLLMFSPAPPAAPAALAALFSHCPALLLSAPSNLPRCLARRQQLPSRREGRG